MNRAEADLENRFIRKLSGLKYRYRSDIIDRLTLETNFRRQFEELNRVRLLDSEFNRLLTQITTGDVFANSKQLRCLNTVFRDDGTPLHYSLVNIKDWCKNNFEVIQQLRVNTTYSHQIYDVVLLINGLPVVQVELKRNGINPREAMKQIVDYKNSHGSVYDNSLLCFIQLFIVSNEKETYYFANNNLGHFNFDANEKFLSIYKHADKDNKKIDNLNEFADSFLPKCTLGEMISRYMVLVETEKKILLMRPYQITAVKNIGESIKQGTNGYIWHTTGSGKTLTSFKAATLLREDPRIYKCLFVVDRKDLDRQTRDEFNRFQENCVEENANTESLVRRLESDDYANKVIVTTIQKLGRALDRSRDYAERLKPLQKQRFVFIFDECHRSQFGEYHKAIREFFPNSQLFGFTGTPIFAENASREQTSGTESEAKTTEHIFHHLLHRYTITHAIEDRNVLPFNVQYYQLNELAQKPNEEQRKIAIVNGILDNHHRTTADQLFNALFATNSIAEAIEYYDLFKAEQDNRVAADTDYRRLKIAAIFSPPAADIQEDLDTEKEDYKTEPDNKKAALERIIADYNQQYNTNHSLAEFDGYYLDLQKRIKDQQYSRSEFPDRDSRDRWDAQKIDITIVVDMMLTGYDSKYLNSLYVDKNLKYHGLIQAFSRTNRILNSTKPFGNIICFRDIREAQERAIELFSGVEGPEAQEKWIVEPAADKIEKLTTAVAAVKELMEDKGLAFDPSQVCNLMGNRAKLEFIEKFKEVQRLERQLDQYIDLTPAEKDRIATILPKEQLRGFKSAYLTTAHQVKPSKAAVEPEAAPPEPELDFEFVLFATVIIDYDYIMDLIANMNGPTITKHKTKEEILELIKSDAKFSPEDYPIWEQFMATIAGTVITRDEVRQKFNQFKEHYVMAEFKTIAAKHGLESDGFIAWVLWMRDHQVFRNEDLAQMVAPFDLAWKPRSALELAIMRDLIPPLKLLMAGTKINGLDAYEE